ncbi:polysaccharide pyruvyl transferase family protein [Fibrobacter sp.]|uniref:polysaccharide pyruvyl transferase family protein n=1 Tax=Fibrobacter sp. TaxID=35828 RepID=UPI003890C114
MKKIGCVIAYRKGHTNYGTALVGYALLKKIQQLGYQVEVINYVKRLSIIQKIAFVWNAVRCGESKIIVARLMSRRLQKKYPQYAANIRTRIKAVEEYQSRKFLPLFKDYVGYESLHEGSKNYDSVVVGSDQVWTPMSLPNKFFNLLFVDDTIRKVAYGSSFGVSSIPQFQQKATGSYLDRFYKIGVREQKGKEIVDSLSRQKAQVVADPTMLLNADEWRQEIFTESEISPSEPYIFCYFLGPNQNARKAANELKAKTGYKIVALLHMDEYVPEDEKFGDETPYDVDPNGFLRLIHNASYVCTDSFHCSAFSIQFHKQFMTFYRFAQESSTGRNSRIDSLFNVLGVSRERLYQGDVSKIDNAIDWNSIDNKLKKLRQESIAFLKESLS